MDQGLSLNITVGEGRKASKKEKHKSNSFWKNRKGLQSRKSSQGRSTPGPPQPKTFEARGKDGFDNKNGNKPAQRSQPTSRSREEIDSLQAKSTPGVPNDRTQSQRKRSDSKASVPASVAGRNDAQAKTSDDQGAANLDTESSVPRPVQEGPRAPFTPANGARAQRKDPGVGSSTSQLSASPMKSSATAATLDVGSKPYGTRKQPRKIDEHQALAETRKAQAKVLAITRQAEELQSSAKKRKRERSEGSITASAPLQSFKDLDLHPWLVKLLESPVSDGGFGFSRPTSIQSKAIPSLLKGQDVLVKSETGSGKTLTFLIPIIQDLQGRQPRVQRSDGTRALILAPTRELCQQIAAVLQKIVRPFVHIVPGSVFGGEKRKSEKARLRKGLTVLVATPGRLLDHLQNTKSFEVGMLQWFVLDEADVLLDMGFEKQIREILEHLQKMRELREKKLKKQAPPPQHVLLSATITKEVSTLSSLILKNPRFIDASSAEDADNGTTAGSKGEEQQEGRSETSAIKEETFVTPEHLEQYFLVVPQKQRLMGLVAFLRGKLEEKKSSKILVFCSTCDSVDFHFELLKRCEWPPKEVKAMAGQEVNEEEIKDAAKKKEEQSSCGLLFGSQPLFKLHGDIPQAERTRAFQSFSSSLSGVLICTDVAARGLHLPTVQWIVQYDPPTEIRDYVHRVGRTARGGKSGAGVLFLLPSEVEVLELFIKNGLNLSPLTLESIVDALFGPPNSASRKKKVETFLSSSSKYGQRHVKKVLEGRESLLERLYSELQFYMDEVVLADKEKLLSLARAAFTSHIRSYATHSADTKHIYNVRGLHLGHVAKSFGLRDPPTSVSGVAKKNGKTAGAGTKRKSHQGEDGKMGSKGPANLRGSARKKLKSLQLSEFVG